MARSASCDALIFSLVALGVYISFRLLRFPDLLSRMHSATKPQVLGLLLIPFRTAIVDAVQNALNSVTSAG